MQKLFLPFIILALTLTITHPLQATVADPRPHTLTQPDGSTLTVRQHGDEWFSWIATPDGYRIVKNQAGIYEYAHPDATQGVKPGGIPARDMAHRSPSDLQYLSTLPLHAGVTPQLIEQSRHEAYDKSMLKSTAATTYFPSAGNRNLLVILVNFSDTQTQYTQSDFHNLMNQPNYNGAGSFNDYYREVSDANTPLNITATVVNWVQLPQTHDYYTSNVGELVITAIEETAKTGVNFDAFDNDNDGTIESVMIVHQGSGRESSTISTDIWSHYHMLSYYSAYSTTASRTFGGKIFNQYVIVPEQNGAQTGISPIGVFCHEFGHALGMVDYYNTNITTNTYSGTGKWDLMANGLWNTDGHVPAHPNPYEKIRLGWATPQTIDTRGSYTLPPVLTSQTIFRINSPDASEYFLLENRIKSNFDAYIPGEGMLIYHIDEDIISTKKFSNTINAGTPMGVALMAANGNITSNNCPFPGTQNIRNFTDETTPSSLTWNDTQTNKPITGIEFTTDKNIQFDFMISMEGSPLSLLATTINDQNIQIDWQRSFENYPVIIAYSIDKSFGKPEDGKLYTVGQKLTGGGEIIYNGNDTESFIHTNLSENTKYYYRIWSNLGTTYSSVLLSNNVTAIKSYPWIDRFENDLKYWHQEYTSQKINWQIENGGFNRQIPSSSFEGNKNALFYSNDTDNTCTSRLISPILISTTTQTFTLTFLHAQCQQSNHQDILKVLYKNRDDDNWIELITYNENINKWQADTLEFTPTGDFQIAFEATGYGGYGVTIDNIIIHPKGNTFSIPSPIITKSTFTNSTTSLTWNPVISETFDSYNASATSIANWNFYDGDNSETYNVSITIDGTKHIIVSKYTGSFVVVATHEPSKLYPYIGNRFLGCVSAKTPPNNDWIISPQIEITGTTWLSFMARSLTATFGMDRLNVLISETDNSPASFIKLNTEPYLEAPESWTLFKYDLSAYLGKKVYFAIQCVSHDALMLMLDAIRVTQREPTCCSFLKSASTPMPLQTLWDKSNEEVTTASHPLKSTAATAGDIQYNIYRNQQLVGTQTGMTNTTFTETVPCGSYDYHIEAVRTIPAAASQSATVTVACNSTDLPQLPGNEATAFYDVLLNCVTIDTPDTNYRLYNASGSLLKQGNTPMVDTQGLPAGLYLLQYSAHQRLHTFKFCKP